jgi:hypothetical protein
MDSNTHSTSEPVELAALEAEVDRLAAQPLDGLTDAALVEGARVMRQQLDRQEGQWLRTLAAVDARGAAGADHGVPAPSTAAWLRNRLRMSASAATSLVRTARALYRGPLTGTGQALVDGELSVAHAQVLASSTHHLPTHTTTDAEPVLLETARRLDPPRLRQAITHLRLVADPDGADRRAERQQERRGLWVSSTWEGMVAVNGLLDPEAGQTLVAALEPLARPANADDARSGGSGGRMRWWSWPAGTWRAAGCPRAGGCDPNCWSPSTCTASSALGGWVARPAARSPWTRRRVGGWPATARSPGSWSPASPLVTTTPAAIPPTRRGWRPNSGRRCGCCPRPWAGPRPSRWRSAAPAGS